MMLSESDFEVLHTGYSEAPRYFKGTHHPYRSEPTSLSLCHFCMFKDVLKFSRLREYVPRNGLNLVSKFATVAKFTSTSMNG